MGLERRGNNYYYYEKERDGGKVRSVYRGIGEMAYLLHQLDLLKKDEAEQERERKNSEKRLEMQTEAELDAAVEFISQVSELLTDAFFLTNGFHQYKRQWRRKRPAKTDSEN